MPAKQIASPLKGQPPQGCILLIRPRGLEPFVSGVLWPEDWTNEAAVVVPLRIRLNPGMVMRSLRFPAKTSRATAEAVIDGLSPEFLQDLYLGGTDTGSVDRPHDVA